MNSETSIVREYVAHYCVGCGLDIGCGQEKIVPEAIGIDLEQGYGDGSETVADWFGLWEEYLSNPWDEYLPGHGPFDYIYSSHLLEDYEDVRPVLEAWRDALVPGGLLILCLPIEKLYRRFCRDIGVERNQAHQQIWDGWEDFLQDVPEGLSVVDGGGPIGVYSFWVVLQNA